VNGERRKDEQITKEVHNLQKIFWTKENVYGRDERHMAVGYMG
jgi:hypothetical protein